MFNAAQVDGYTPKVDPDAPIEQRIESAELFFARINARVVHQGNRAFYSPDTDSITLPPFAAFFAPSIITARGPMKPGIGHLRPAVAIVS